MILGMRCLQEQIPEDLAAEQLTTVKFPQFEKARESLHKTVSEAIAWMGWFEDKTHSWKVWTRRDRQAVVTQMEKLQHKTQGNPKQGSTLGEPRFSLEVMTTET